MPFVTRNCIENIKRQVNIYDVVSPVVSLKKSGRNFVGLSPFSNEKTPSFFILPEKNIFKCFSSGYAGDIFRFIELTEKLTFNEAVEAIANRFNQPIEYESGSAAPAINRSLRKEILEIHEQAADYYHRAFLADRSDSQAIRKYWTEVRKFPLALAKEFKIGFAPPDDEKLAGFLTGKNYSIEALKKCGLFFTRDGDTNPQNFRPRFRGRLMIPIRDYQGQVIAFTARQLDITPEDDPAREAKYINSPETPIFHKSSIVFGLDRARQHIDEAGKFVMVEGQLDALRCWQCGLKTAIAPQGTSITEAQLSLLKRYAGRIDCILDGDDAGQKAALRMLPLALKAGHEVRFIVLPPGADPDSMLAEGGSGKFEELSGQAVSAIEFAVRTLLPQENPSPQEKSHALQNLFEIIGECDMQVIRDDYLAAAASLMRVDYHSVQSDFARFMAKRRRRSRFSSPENSEIVVEEKQPQRLTTSEYELLLLAFHYERLLDPIAEVVDSEWIDQTFTHGRLLSRILAEIHEGLWEGIEKIDHLLENDEERNTIYSIMAEEPVFENPAKIAEICVRSLLDKYVKEKSRQIEVQIANLPTPSEKFPNLQRQLIELRRLKQHQPTLTVSSLN